MRDYELMYIVRPDLDDEALRAATESVAVLVRGLGGEIRKTSVWGRRRLAYEINHLRDGHYVLIEIGLDGDRVTELERALTIHDTVFRHLLVRSAPAAAGAEGEAEEGEEQEEGGPPAEVAGTFAGEGVGDDGQVSGDDEFSVADGDEEE